jgi:hypothetical protein
MDALEQMALDLETAQQKRKKKALAAHSLKSEQDFWTVHEFTVFETIKHFREKSRTYNSDK